MITFTEKTDRFEANVEIGSLSFLVSLDKPANKDQIDHAIDLVETKAQEILQASLAYFETNKERYGVPYIDDLSDPQLMVGHDSLSVYWWSDKGEQKGECIIGVDFSKDTLVPFQLVIGD